MKGKSKQEFETSTQVTPSLDSASIEQQESPPGTDPLALNFHSAEFNTVDDLDDNKEDFRAFSSLEGIITADMRFHEERKKKKKNGQEDSLETEDFAAQNIEEKNVEQQELAPLTLTSKGRTLIISSDLEAAIECGEQLCNQGFPSVLCIPSDERSNPAISSSGFLVIVEADNVKVSGSFCGFTAITENNGKSANLSTMLGDTFDLFDLVLDLQPEPVYTGKQLPVGYFFAPEKTKEQLAEDLEELQEMRGRFTKPQFTFLRENDCIHSRNGRVSCQRCLEICPVNAIRSDGRKIVIDHYLCQGCMGCDLVCPTGAIQMTTGEDHLPEIYEQLGNYIGTQQQPALVLYDSSIDDMDFRNKKDNLLFIEHEEIASAGLHVPLSAMAMGAGSVVVLCDKSRPERIRKALQHQVKVGRIILDELDLPTECIRFAEYSSDNVEEKIFSENIGPIDALTDFTPASIPPGQDKRTLVRMAIQHLNSASGNDQTFIPLPAGEPFGAIKIDPDACSLCMACVSVCPSKSLAASGDVPRVSMVESRCHQCGLCAAACPENAVELLPRILTDLESAESPSILHEVEPFRCVECGVPFASQAMVSRMLDKLNDHWMYGNEQQKRRLEMCRTCRTRDALTSGDYR